ncbi:hypothetical protein QBC38DRAFT_75983 [Podospora fimiseda]|uniref:Uncharacterized protein n=1 Tax=Podospora fimiseda TaxID=252190 RepID=A0AAN7BUJ0_9PEZI|nr:hypothetical protein QBC38DRAFT_75983 [Podospora fimiseda]
MCSTIGTTITTETMPAITMNHHLDHLDFDPMTRSTKLPLTGVATTIPGGMEPSINGLAANNQESNTTTNFLSSFLLQSFFTTTTTTTTTYPLTFFTFSTVVATTTFLLIIMCTLTILYHPCRHHRPFRIYCKDAMTRHHNRNDYLTSGQHPKSSRSRNSSSGRRSMLRQRLLRSPQTQTQTQSSDFSDSDSDSATTTTPSPPSSPRLTPNRLLPSSRGDQRIICNKYKTIHTETHTVCFKRNECEFERVNRCWKCCRCKKGPNRQSRCGAGDCRHDVCGDCTEYVFPPIPVYMPELGDWGTKPTVTTAIVDEDEHDGDTTESDEEAEIIVDFENDDF